MRTSQPPGGSQPAVQTPPGAADAGPKPRVRLRAAVLCNENGETGRHRAYAAALVALGWDATLFVPARLPVGSAVLAEDGVRVVNVPVSSPDQLRLWAARGLSEESLRGGREPRLSGLARLRLACVRFGTEMRRAWRWNTVAAERTAALEAAYGPLLDAYAPDAIRADEELCIVVGRAAAARRVAAGRSLLLVSETLGDVLRPASLTELALVAAEDAPSGQVDVPAADANSADVDAADAPSDDVASDQPPFARFAGAASPAIHGRLPRAERVVRIGPTNMAGQGWAWGRAVERRLPGTAAEVVALTREGALSFPADRRIAPEDPLDRRWQLGELVAVLDGVTHALAEGGMPVVGRLHGPYFDADVPLLARLGIPLGLVFHGSDIRDPVRHRELEKASPFTDPEDAAQAQLQRNTERVAARVADFDGPIFVSTPDLLDDVPRARWLPVVVDSAVWTPGPPPLARDVPVVVHAPSNRRMKGTELIEPAVLGLAEAGRIDYRRIENVPPERMPELIRDADIVLDHFVIGNYSVLTCQAMAAGRVTLGNVADRVRERVPADIPVVQATPEDVGPMLEAVLEDREAAVRQAARGPDFVRRFHDGRMSASVLADFLGVPPPADAEDAIPGG